MKWDKNTPIWGVVDEDGDGAGGRDHPDTAFSKNFLEMAEYGKEGRIYTYMIIMMLDGQWRFTVRV